MKATGKRCGPCCVDAGGRRLTSELTDPALMRGDGWVRCCICGELHTEPFERLAVDDEGQRWDVCAGECAVEAGIVPGQPKRV
jgi:hypothetical protein